MLSICIPIYNYDISRLVKELHRQAVQTERPFEILTADDASDETFRTKNRQINLPNMRYIQLNENIGRSKIRNRLADEAKYPNLLFMDCDSAILSSLYIANYITSLDWQTVCCGGRTYENVKPDDSTLLRWKYGVERESMPASKRSKNPNVGFCSNNFLIPKDLFRQVKFDETITGYGHEDTLFGLELLARGIIIRHINNPLIHLGLESASAFLEKTENGIANLYKIEILLRRKYPQFISHSRLMRSKLALQKFRLTGFAAMIFNLLRQPMKQHLLGKHPSLRVFDLYRLGMLCSVAYRRDSLAYLNK